MLAAVLQPPLCEGLGVIGAGFRHGNHGHGGCLIWDEAESSQRVLAIRQGNFHRESTRFEAIDTGSRVQTPGELGKGLAPLDWIFIAQFLVEYRVDCRLLVGASRSDRFEIPAVLSFILRGQSQDDVLGVFEGKIAQGKSDLTAHGDGRILGECYGMLEKLVIDKAQRTKGGDTHLRVIISEDFFHLCDALVPELGEQPDRTCLDVFVRIIK